MKKVLKRFGKYLLLDLLAQGGMAEIYRAWAPSIDGGGRLIVLKCVQPDYGSDPEFLQMFRSEIRVTMGLNHPNIVQLYDFGEVDDRPYIAMEYVEGKNLKQFIGRVLKVDKSMPPEVAAYVISQIAGGLHYAHAYRDRTSGEHLHIIHRDISPQNLLISYDGNAKIIDFGIAKAKSNRQATRSGVIKGKPSYLSPEQIEGIPLDARSDLFSLGTVLWEVLTGRKLFSAESDLAAIQLIEECHLTVKPPSVLNPKVPKELDAIVMKSLAKNRNERYNNAEEMQRALHRFVYTYKPGFDPSTFTKHIQVLFKSEIEQEQKMIQQLNAEGAHLISATAEPPTSAAGPGRSDISPIRHEFGPADLSQSQDIQFMQPIRPKAERATPPKKTASTSRSGGGFVIPILAIGAALWFLPDKIPGLISKFGTSSDVQEKPPAQTQPLQAKPQPVAAVQGTRGLKLNIVPAGGVVQILLNEVAVNPDSIQLPVGTQTKVKIIKAGFLPAERTYATLPGSQDLQEDVTLEAQPYGTLSLNTTPSAHAKIIGGDLTWYVPTPISGMKLPPGRYQVQLVNQLLGMKKDLSFEIQSGKKLSQDVNLEVVQ